MRAKMKEIMVPSFSGKEIESWYEVIKDSSMQYMHGGTQRNPFLLSRQQIKYHE